MYLLSLLAVMALVFVVIAAVFSALSGVGVMVMFSLGAVVCIIVGAGLMLRLLAKGVFSLLKCVVMLAALLIPTVNVIALAVIVYAFFRSVRKAV